jgi:Gluconate 2-dehydrogenase subunit 3
MTRRTLLRRGLFGGALLALGSLGGLALWPTRVLHRPRRALKVLDERGFAIVAAIGARTVGSPRADAVEIAHGVDDELGFASPESRNEIRQLLLLFESAAAGVLFDARLRPFTHLDADEQDAVLRAWRDSRLAVRRTGYTALRKATQAAYYVQPSCWAEVGYPGPPQIGVLAPVASPSAKVPG